MDEEWNKITPVSAWGIFHRLIDGKQWETTVNREEAFGPFYEKNLQQKKNKKKTGAI